MNSSEKARGSTPNEQDLMHSQHRDVLINISRIREEISYLTTIDTSLTEQALDKQIQLLSSLTHEAEQLEKVIASSTEEKAFTQPRFFSKHAKVPPNTPTNIEMLVPESVLTMSNSPDDSSDEEYGRIIPDDPFIFSLNR